MSIWDEVDALNTKMEQEEKGIIEEETVVVEDIVEEQASETTEPEIQPLDWDTGNKSSRKKKNKFSKYIKGLIFIVCGVAFTVIIIMLVITLGQSGKELKSFQNEVDSMRNLQEHSINETDLSGGAGFVWDKVLESE